MPLTAGLRDEENERINNVLKKLIGLDYVPGFSGSELDQDLAGLGLDSAGLLAMTAEETVAHVEKFHLDWVNAELFADFLVSFGNAVENAVPTHNAIAVYNYIQSESKMFSFGIINKIAMATSRL